VGFKTFKTKAMTINTVITLITIMIRLINDGDDVFSEVTLYDVFVPF